jgi:hypothetical protein
MEKRTHRQTEQNDQAAEGRGALARKPGPQRSGGHLPLRGSGRRSRASLHLVLKPFRIKSL